MVHGLVGSIFGYFVLHPIAMAVFAYFEPGRGSGELEFVLGRAMQSFSFGMLPMALVFATFSMVIGAMDGYYRSLLRFQRDDLASQLVVNERYRQRLETQNSALKELSRTKRRMTYFLMHDIKNHLGCVLGYAKLLLGRDENATWSEGDRDAVAKINRQATRMAGAVRDVLDLALGTTFFFTIPNQQPATFGGKNGESTDV
jgi:signal transduction histidine kinase